MAGVTPTINTGNVSVEISNESADALALVDGLRTTWEARPTMVRGSKKVAGDVKKKPAAAPSKKRLLIPEGCPRSKKVKTKEQEPEPCKAAAELTEKDFRRTTHGDHAIESKVQELFDLDAETWPGRETFDPQSLRCRIADEGAQRLVWDRFKDASAACVAALLLGGSNDYSLRNILNQCSHVLTLLIGAPRAQQVNKPGHAIANMFWPYYLVPQTSTTSKRDCVSLQECYHPTI